MRKSLSDLPVSVRTLTIPIAPAGAVRIVCGAMGLALIMLIFRIVAQL